MHPFVVGPNFKQRDRKNVAAGFQFLAATDFVSLLNGRSRSEERLHAIFRNLLLGGVGQQNDSGFVVLRLPSGKKAIGRCQGADVLAI